jgi:hypothetical protein
MSTISPVPVGRNSARQVESGLSVPEHDYINITYNLSNQPTMVVYRIGGPSGNIVATISMSYDGSGNLTTVQRVS